MADRHRLTIRSIDPDPRGASISAAACSRNPVNTSSARPSYQAAEPASLSLVMFSNVSSIAVTKTLAV